MLDSHKRETRGIQAEITGEQTIEALLTLDRSIAQFYGVDAAKEYALSVANVVFIFLTFIIMFFFFKYSLTLRLSVHFYYFKI